MGVYTESNSGARVEGYCVGCLSARIHGVPKGTVLWLCEKEGERASMRHLKGACPDPMKGMVESEILLSRFRKE